MSCHEMHNSFYVSCHVMSFVFSAHMCFSSSGVTCWNGKGEWSSQQVKLETFHHSHTMKSEPKCHNLQNAGTVIYQQNLTPSLLYVPAAQL